MVKIPTVLILGAGASVPYGYPTGNELREKIITIAFRGAGQETDHFVNMGFDPKDILDFGKSFLEARSQSIDAFLENNQKHAEIGKCLISYILLPIESNTFLLHSPKKRWYDLLKDYLREDCNPNTFNQNNLSIITFNYDRSLDHYLHSAFSKDFNLSELTAKKFMESIDIIHMYGSLGPLPWQTEDPTLAIDYAEAEGQFKNLNVNHVKNSSQNIKLIGEARADSSDVKRAHKQLKAAQRIYFLGFGYHAENIRLLAHGRQNTYQLIKGTMQGITPAFRSRILNLLEGIYHNFISDTDGTKDAFPDSDVLEFLEHTAYIE